MKQQKKKTLSESSARLILSFPLSLCLSIPIAAMVTWDMDISLSHSLTHSLSAG